MAVELAGRDLIRPKPDVVSRFIGAIAVGAVALLWAWTQGANALALGTTTVSTLLAALLLSRSSAVSHRVAAGVLAVTAGYWLAGFYLSGRSTDAHTWVRLERLAGGPYLLSAGSLVGLLLLNHYVQRALQRRGQLGGLRGYVIGGLLAFVVAGDLFFLKQGPLLYEPERDQLRHPFLASRYGRLGTYGFVHATERWVTDNRNTRFEQRKPAGVTRIILEGASTAYGHGLSDAECLATRLREALQRERPRQQFEVLTIAYPGNYQVNELIDTVVLFRHWSPDLVISFNGYNEVSYGEAPHFFEGMPLGFFDVPESVDPLSSALARVSHFAAARRLSTLQRLRANTQKIDEPHPYEPPRYYSYLQLTASTLANMGVPYAYAFCPTVLAKTTRTVAEQKHAEVAAGHRRGFAEGTAAAVLQRTARANEIVEREKQIAYDVMAVLDTDEEAFIDDCHLNAAATIRVAADLASRIPQWLQ